MQAAVRRMLERRVDGVAVLTFGMEESVLNDLKLRNVPMVFVDVGLQRSRVSNIRIDCLNGVRQALRHLEQSNKAQPCGQSSCPILGGPLQQPSA
jgi:LacI family transcriptional regulator